MRIWWHRGQSIRKTWLATQVQYKIITERCGWTHTDDIVLRAKRVYHSLVPVTSEPLNDHLHREPETTVNTPTTTSAVSVQYFNHMLQLNMVKELLGLWIFVNIGCVNCLCWIAPSQVNEATGPWLMVTLMVYRYFHSGHFWRFEINNAELADNYTINSRILHHMQH